MDKAARRLLDAYASGQPASPVRDLIGDTDIDVPLSDFEPRDVTMTLLRDGAGVPSGTGTACLGSPLNAVAWLANTARHLDRFRCN